MINLIVVDRDQTDRFAGELNVLELVRYNARMDRPSVIRGLRIASSAVFGILCVLLVVLWVRSYNTEDTAVGGTRRIAVGIQSQMSRAAFMACILTNERDLWGSISSDHIRREPPKFSWNAPLSSGIESILTSVEPEWWKPSPWFQNHLGFAFVLDTRPWNMIVVPHWFLLLVVASAAASPWIHWTKRFTLRTLLIATTLIAVVLGLVVAPDGPDRHPVPARRLSLEKNWG